MDPQEHSAPAATSPGAAASYYHSTSPVPVPGATVLTSSGPLSGLGLGGPSSSGHALGGAGVPGGPHASGSSGVPQQQRPPTFDPPPLVHVQSPQLGAVGVAAPGLTQSPGPITATAVTGNKPPETDIKAARSGAEFALREYMSLQRRRYRTGDEGASVASGDLEVRIKAQSEVVKRDLGRLRAELVDLARAAEQHRWRKWLIGGILGTFIPAVRAIFRRTRDDPESGRTSNDTEYAFFRSKSLVGRILDSVHGIGGLASLTFFVFAVLYVFQNEVSMRVAKTVGKRLKRLSTKVEADADIDERDMALLNGWRWRVLAWS